MSDYKGRQNAITQEDLTFRLRAKGEADLSPRSVRQVIEHIRREDLMKPGFIVSSASHGYWYTTDKQEQGSFLDQELNRMANQFDNLSLLHQRLRKTKTSDKIQPTLF